MRCDDSGSAEFLLVTDRRGDEALLRADVPAIRVYVQQQVWTWITGTGPVMTDGYGWNASKQGVGVRQGGACPAHPRSWTASKAQDVDARDKPGHDGGASTAR